MPPSRRSRSSARSSNAASANARFRYLLGDSRREAARLRAQARLWDPVAHALFDRIAIRRGWTVLEIGPGQGSLHLELRRRVRGPVDAVERSPAFAARIAALARRDGYGSGRVWQCDLRDARLPRAHYDLIFARWVFLFLPDPLAHVRQLARALKPGGVIAIQDYHRESFAMIPRPLEWANFIAADRSFFATQGGDASVGGRLPRYYRAAGLRVIEASPTIKLARPGDAAWNWITGYFASVIDRYAKIPPLSRAQALRLKRHWSAAAREQTSFMIAPTVIDVVGRKPRRGARPYPRG